MFESMLSHPGSLFSELERLQRDFDDWFGRGQPSGIRAVAPGTFPPINVGTTPASVEIYAFAPGIDPKSIDVSVEKGLLTISGNRTTGAEDGKESREGKDEIAYARERFTGPFRRVVSLPEDADTTKVEASYRNGVLKLVVPRLEAARPRQIAVNR